MLRDLSACDQRSATTHAAIIVMRGKPYCILFWLFQSSCKAWNTLGQPLDIWSIWGDSDEFGNKSVQCVQLRWKLLEPRGRCLLQFNMQSLRRLAVGRRSHWILWLVMCHLYDHSDWRCANESARCVGGAEYCVRFVFLCTLFRHFLFSCFGVLARD